MDIVEYTYCRLSLREGRFENASKAPFRQAKGDIISYLMVSRGYSRQIRGPVQFQAAISLPKLVVDPL